MLLFSHRLFSYECGAVIVVILFCFVFIYLYSLCDKRKSSKIASKLPSMYSYNFFKALSNFIIDISMIEWQISTTTTTITTTTKEKKWNLTVGLNSTIIVYVFSLTHSFIHSHFLQFGCRSPKQSIFIWHIQHVWIRIYGCTATRTSHNSFNANIFRSSLNEISLNFCFPMTILQIVANMNIVWN